jgi:hypothetical protein
MWGMKYLSVSRTHVITYLNNNLHNYCGVLMAVLRASLDTSKIANGDRVMLKIDALKRTPAKSGRNTIIFSISQPAESSMPVRFNLTNALIGSMEFELRKGEGSVVAVPTRGFMQETACEFPPMAEAASTIAMAMLPGLKVTHIAMPSERKVPKFNAPIVEIDGPSGRLGNIEVYHSDDSAMAGQLAFTLRPI